MTIGWQQVLRHDDCWTAAQTPKVQIHVDTHVLCQYTKVPVTVTRQRGTECCNQPNSSKYRRLYRCTRILGYLVSIVQRKYAYSVTTKSIIRNRSLKRQRCYGTFVKYIYTSGEAKKEIIGLSPRLCHFAGWPCQHLPVKRLLMQPLNSIVMQPCKAGQRAVQLSLWRSRVNIVFKTLLRKPSAPLKHRTCTLYGSPKVASIHVRKLFKSINWSGFWQVG